MFNANRQNIHFLSKKNQHINWDMTSENNVGE
jgi:hypothetical protein